MQPREQKLLDLLSHGDVTFFIPPYQRNYEWTDEQCRVFWDDIKKTCDSNKSGIHDEHFFGTITYFSDETPYGEPAKLVLIDGQQRITTTMLFLVAVRDTLQDDPNICAFIDSRYLKNERASGDSEYKVKLKQVETDWLAYKNLILELPMSEREKDSAVFRNYKFFLSQLKIYRDGGNDIKELLGKGIDKFSVITVQLEPYKNKWENPQDIFESMNSLGKPLSLADLVRNRLLLGLEADEQTRLYNQYWLHIESVIPKHISDLIRDYMQCIKRTSFLKASESNFKALYSSFKEIFQDVNPESLLKELSEYADYYSCLINGTSCGNKRIDSLIADIRIIRTTTAYSFLMSLMKAWKIDVFTDEELIQILNTFRIYCYRRKLLGLNAAENKNFPMLSNKINDLKEARNKALKMFEILSNQENNLRLPNDVEIKQFLSGMNFFNFAYKKLYLSLIEESLTKSRPDQNDIFLQVEHIMPQTLNDKWREDLGENAEEIHQTYVNNIGNLTLIRHNQELGQKSFFEKKEIYENKAGLQIARKCITDQSVWNDKTIEERTAWISEYMVNDVLPIPDEMRRTNNFSMNGSRGLSFIALQLIGEEINFIGDKSIKAKVISDKEVEFEGKKWRLSPLTKEIRKRKGAATLAKSYQGAFYWEYEDLRLADQI